MKSPIIKRSIVLGRRKTSVSLEDPFWDGFKEIAKSGDVNVSELLTALDSNRQDANLASTIRVFVLDYYRGRVDRPKASPAREGQNETLVEAVPAA